MIFLCILLAASSFLNGATDAANTVTGAVCSGILKPTSACALAAVMEALGNALSCALFPSVAMLISDMADLPRGFGDREGVCIAALCAVAVWSAAAWAAGLPTSEGHGLMAALAGCAVQAGGTVSLRAAAAVFIGLAMSVLGGALSLAAVKIFSRFAQSLGPQKKFCIASLCASAFMHGAQDGQKFAGVILLSMILVNGQTPGDTISIPLWLMILCSLVMAAGTAIGGKKIIKSVGMDMVKLEKYQGFSADIAASFSLLLSSVFGIPVSTTHAKTTAIMGVGAARRLSNVNLGVVKDMALTWILTFPGCGLIGFLMTELFMWLFK